MGYAFVDWAMPSWFVGEKKLGRTLAPAGGACATYENLKMAVQNEIVRYNSGSMMVKKARNYV